MRGRSTSVGAGLRTLLQANTCVSAHRADWLTAVRVDVARSVGSSDVEEDTLFRSGIERSRVGGRIGIAVVEEVP